MPQKDRIVSSKKKNLPRRTILGFFPSNETGLALYPSAFSLCPCDKQQDRSQDFTGTVDGPINYMYISVTGCKARQDLTGKCFWLPHLIDKLQIILHKQIQSFRTQNKHTCIEDTFVSWMTIWNKIRETNCVSKISFLN